MYENINNFIIPICCLEFINLLKHVAVMRRETNKLFLELETIFKIQAMTLKRFVWRVIHYDINVCKRVFLSRTKGKLFVLSTS